jgi:DNA polymerase-3 subunit delta'
MNLILHEQTSAQITKFLSSPSHALLLEGQIGSGKGYLAEYLVVKLLHIDQHKLASYPYLLKVTPINKVISIEAVREVQKFMHLKTMGDGDIRRVLIMQDAQAMTTEAQNALLKLLEEPPEDTALILTSIPSHSLLSTIYSRLQKISVKPPHKHDVVTFFESKNFRANDIERAYYLSEGQVGLMDALLTENAGHSLNSSIVEAKMLVTNTTFERLSNVDRLSKQKDNLPELLYALERVYRSVLMNAVDKANDKAIRQSHRALKLILEAQSRLAMNPNIKLLLADLFLNL